MTTIKTKGHILIVDCTSDFEQMSKPLFSSFALVTTRVPSCLSAIEIVKQSFFKMVVINLREGLHEECHLKFHEMCTNTKCAILVGVHGSAEFARTLRLDLLMTGADVVLVNPCDKELAYQTIAIMRRICEVDSKSYWADEDIITAQMLEILIPFRRVFVEGIEVLLPPKEFDIFVFLARSPWTVKSYEEIYTSVWNQPFEYVSHEVLHSHISRLRALLKVSPQAPEYIRNSKCIGYSFQYPDTDI